MLTTQITSLVTWFYKSVAISALACIRSLRTRFAPAFALAILLIGGALSVVWAQGSAKNAIKPIPGPGSTLAQNPVAPVPHTTTLPYGLPLMARFDLLPMLRDTRCFQDSSYDPSGGNGDADHYFKKEGNRAILSDIKGPGCIYRFWSANAAGHLKIFFDEETTPRIDCPMQDLFLGKVAPFVSPLVGHKSGGWFCFFPMPFAKCCRIEVTDPGALYYHVEYQRFPDQTPVTTFTRQLSATDQAALDTVVAQWKSLGSNPLTAPVSNLADYRSRTHVASAIVSVPAGQTRTLATLQGAGEVTALHLGLVPADRLTLRQTLLRVYWDGASKPAIESPVGDFYGVGFGNRTVRALPTAMLESGYTCYWPMPFARSARFELVNTGKTDLSAVSYRIESQRLSKPLENAGYFHAQWHRETTVRDEPFHILQVKGRGHYVGEHTDMQGDHGIWFLEGDEKVYVDGETFPSIHGTGTEDFYTGGWYFDEGPFNLAYHGCTVKQESISRVSAYRYQITDCVPFQHDFKIDIEHGGTNDYPGADYSCVAYWYQDGPTHDWSPVKLDQLTPTYLRTENAQEAESLTWTGGKASVVADDLLSMEASGGKVVVLSGAKPTATFSVKSDDNYTLHLATLALPDGVKTLGLSVDGDTMKNSVLTSEGGHAEASRFVHLRSGTHTLALEVPAGGHAYVDYLRVEPSRKEKDVLEGEALLDSLDGHGKSDATLSEARPQYSGGSALRWQPAKANETLALPVHVEKEADYTLEMAVDADETTPDWTLQIAQGAAQTAHLPAGAKGVSKLRFGGLIHLKPGTYTLILSGGAKPGLTLDWLKLVKARYAGAVEAESLKVLEHRDGNVDTQDMKGFGGDWSGDTQLWFHAEKVGAEMTLELPVATAGKYTLVVYYTTAKDYGTVQALIDGNPVGTPTDCYTSDVKAKGRLPLGTVDLTAGMHRLTFRVTGKNPASSNWLVGVDAIGLEPAQ